MTVMLKDRIFISYLQSNEKKSNWVGKALPKKAVTENTGIKCSFSTYPFLDYCPDWISYLG